MNTKYEIITKCKAEKQNPVIGSYTVSKEQWMRVQEIVHENDRKPDDKYPFMNKKGGIEK